MAGLLTSEWKKMALDRLAILGIKVDPTGAVRGAKTAGNAIKGIGTQAVAVKNAVFSLQGALVAIGGTAVATSFIRTASSMERLRTQLKTLTGSTQNAADAFDFLTDFTTRTPYEIEQVTEAYAKLKALGLDPTEESLTSFGNTASAMGRDLNQMIEAVADATTMEFERLKEFGIKASQEGDNVKFTFQGVTTSVQKNAADIESYLIAIGNNQFGGAMADQMNTFDGAISNLRGSWTLFQDQLMNSGPFDLLKGLIDQTASALFGDPDSVTEAATHAGMAITTFMQDAILGAATVMDFMKPLANSIKNTVNALWEGFNALPDWAKEIGVVGALVFGKKGKVALLTMAAAGGRIKDITDWTTAYLNGQIGAAEFFTATLDEIPAKLEALRKTTGALAQEGGSTSLIKMIFGDPTEDEGSYFNRALAMFDEMTAKAAAARAAANQTSDDVTNTNTTVTTKIKTQWQEVGEAIQGAWDKAASSIENNLADAILGLKSWKDAAKSILNEVAREFIRVHVLKGFVTGVSNSIAGAFGLPTGETTDVPSANGGGFTGRGARSGGVDGKGGFPAILHPNETVIDHTKGQSGGVVVNQVINVTTGVQQTVRTEIQNMLPQIANASKAAVLDARKRGGSFAGAFA